MMTMTTNLQELYEETTGEELDLERRSASIKYCQWLELEFGHELARWEIQERQKDQAER